MKIKLAILEKDRSYLTRIVAAFGAKYAGKFEIYSFTNEALALESLHSARIDVLLANDAFSIDVSRLPSRCGFAYLVDSADVDMVNNQMAICKFQKIDLLYKQILAVYSEKAGNITGIRAGEGEGDLIVFCSAGGGAGGSTMAAACALHFAAQGKKTLYLNLEKFGMADLFFSGQGQFDMSDVIFALKSKKANLPMKLESCVRQDPRGVSYYAGAKIALDLMELNTDEILRLLSELQLTGQYQYIILDMDFSLNKEALRLYRQAQAIVMVSDGSVISNAKTERAFTALKILEQNTDAPLSERMCLVYNKFSSKNGKPVNVPELRVIGGTPKYERASVEQILAQLSPMELFDKILNA